MKKLLSVFCTIALFGAVTFQVVSCTQIDDEDLTETTELTFDIKVINASSPNYQEKTNLKQHFFITHIKRVKK